MLDKITPVLLTYNEEANLKRTLSALAWAEDIVIVDSFSTDRTVDISQRHRAVRIFQRRFDTHAQQWNYATQKTEIESDWILALDADYVLTSDFVKELRELEPGGNIVAYRAGFRYLVAGVPLRGSLYPPVAVLFRRGHGHYLQDGHTQRLDIEGEVGNLTAKIDHDDRKPLAHWLLSQDRYARLEAEKMRYSPSCRLQLRDKIRKFPTLAPFIVFLYCYFGKGLFLDGKFGLYYAFQRLLAEALLALHIIANYFDKHLTNRKLH
jgi:glycosyltransferase involved in cell wall biosynthesis